MLKPNITPKESDLLKRLEHTTLKIQDFGLSITFLLTFGRYTVTKDYFHYKNIIITRKLRKHKSNIKYEMT